METFQNSYGKTVVETRALSKLYPARKNFFQKMFPRRKLDKDTKKDSEQNIRKTSPRYIHKDISENIHKDISGNIHKTSPEKNHGTLALVGLDLKVKKGQIYGLLGPNGAGKTTLIKILTGLMPPTSGMVKVCGHDILEEKITILEKIGYMPEIPAFYKEIRTSELIKYFADLQMMNRALVNRRIEDILQTVGLKSHTNKYTQDLSHGLKKRLSLALALLNNPELLILDEPTSGLDPRGKRDFYALLRSLRNRGITIFMSTHLLLEVPKICTHVGILSRGKLLESGSLEHLKRKISKKGKVKINITYRGEKKPDLSVLRALEGVVDVEMGDHSLVVYSHGEEVSMRLNRILVNEGINVNSLIVEEPGLEDIFIHRVAEEK